MSRLVFAVSLLMAVLAAAAPGAKAAPARSYLLGAINHGTAGSLALDPHPSRAVLNGCNCSAWPEKLRFAVIPPPLVPEPVSPLDGSTTHKTRPIFEWSATDWAEGYRLQVDNDADLASPVIDETTSGTTYRPDSPMPYGTYHWRVQGIYDLGISEWSRVSSFAILPTDLAYGAYLPLAAQGAQKR